MNEDKKLELLKDILLVDEKADLRSIEAKINEIEDILGRQIRLREKINPIIQEELEKYSDTIPQELGPVITETLKVQIANSKDQVVEALFPILGLMIKKYIAHEIKVLAENIEKKTKNTFSFLNFKRKIRSTFIGVDETDIIISETAQAQIDQVFIIDMHSGILLGSYIDRESVDEDMIGGMLTAIKSFVEDAFHGRNQKLNSIKYDLYEIHLYNSYSYYIATAVNGTLTDKLEQDIDDIAIEISSRINKENIIDDKSKMDQLLFEIYSKKQLKS